MRRTTPKHDSFLEGKEGTTCDTLPQKGTVCPFVKSSRLVNPQKGTNRETRRERDACEGRDKEKKELEMRSEVRRRRIFAEGRTERRAERTKRERDREDGGKGGGRRKEKKVTQVACGWSPAA